MNEIIFSSYTSYPVESEDERTDLLERDWDSDVYMPMERLLEKNNLIMRCELKLWDGKHDGGSVITDIKQFDKCLKDAEDAEVAQCDDHLELRVEHHDGTNVYKFRVLTDEGEDYNANYEDQLELRELHKRLWEEPYSKPVVFD